MIDKAKIEQVVSDAIAGTDLFLVEVTVSRDNVVDVALDSMGSVSIDACVAVNNAVLAAFDRDEEDFELTVGSYGITSPLKVRRQYDKSVGGEVEVLTGDGRKLRGTLVSAGESTFTVAVPTRVKTPGKKRPEVVAVEHELRYDEIKYTKNIIQF